MESKLLTTEEAIAYLRLDTIDVKRPENTLRYYRDAGLLKGTKISRGLFYSIDELDRFIAKVTKGGG